MPQATPKWKTRMPKFIDSVVTATAENNENLIKSECETIKNIVVEGYPNTPDSRKMPMAAIRKAVRDRFPAKQTTNQDASFPYYFTTSEKGNIPRWEHLAIKYLSDKENQKNEQIETEIKAATETEIDVEVESEPTPLELLEVFELTDDESEIIKQAVGDTDVKEWVKQAIMQRAKAINKLRESLDADWELIPSEVLMNDKRYRTNSGACRELVSRAVRVIKAWNHDHPEQKWCITNKLISELTGITVKAIARAVEGMDIDSYNKNQDLSPVVNRMVRVAVGEPSQVMSLAKVTSVEGSEQDYH
jgi:hypothetical protein